MIKFLLLKLLFYILNKSKNKLFLKLLGNKLELLN